MGKSAFEVYGKKKTQLRDKTKKNETKKKIKTRAKLMKLPNSQLKKEIRRNVSKPKNVINKKTKKKKIKLPSKNVNSIEKEAKVKENKILMKNNKVINKNETKETVENINFNEEKFDVLPQEVFSYLISPIKPNIFFSDYWEKGCLHIRRNSKEYYKDFLSSEKLDDIIRNNPVYYTRNIDVVTYENDERKTHNPEGRAIPASVWDYYSNGCSVRLLNPQTYNKKIRNLLSMLQEYFGTMAGANVYLTPPGSQGFAPHYDDIEAFVLQVEGRKHWKIYKPPTDHHKLPRYSSKNFKREELGEPMELTVETGDLLYFPRGYIHEARTDDASHSLHITVSVYQNTAYVDLIEKSLMQSLQVAAASNIEYRRGLPIQYLKHLGIANSNVNSSIRNQVISTVKNLVAKLSDYISVDDGADQLGRKFIYDSLPPQLSSDEKQRSCREDGDFLQNGNVLNKGVFEPDTHVRLVRYHAVRLTLENNVNKLYYSTENANVYHGEEEQYLEINSDMVETIKILLQNYPNYTKIEDLPSEDQVSVMHVISDLWEKGLIITQQSLSVYEDN